MLPDPQAFFDAQRVLVTRLHAEGLAASDPETRFARLWEASTRHVLILCPRCRVAREPWCAWQQAVAAEVVQLEADLGADRAMALTRAVTKRTHEDVQTALFLRVIGHFLSSDGS